jgi:Nif-specific regulatory protein
VVSVDKEFESDEQFRRDLQLLDIISSSLAQAVRIHMMADEVRKELEDRNIYLRSELSRKFSFANIIGSSQGMQEVFQRIQMVAKSRATVLIRGESGTGKELVAKAIHFNSPLKEKPFIKVDCATIPETLLESELFGHMRGSFTGAIADKKGKFEVADGGTIFLDEIAEMAPSLQAKLLRVLQERVIEPIGSNKPRAISVRVIAATNRDLEKNMTEGKFREDLYYRLNVVPIFLPPLRARKQDIPYLVDYFLEKFNKENKKELKISPELYAQFMSYSWPGNVRELENLVERLVIMCESRVAGPEMVSFSPAPGAAAQERPAEPAKTGPQSLADLEREALLKALNQADGVQVQAARILGITLRQLRYRMSKYGIRKNFSTA